MKMKDLLDAKGMTAYALSKKTGLSSTTVYKYTREASDAMPLTTAAKIAKALDMSLDEFYKTMQPDQAPDLTEGWNDISDTFCVLVEDGKLIRGVRGKDMNQKTVYPYLPVKDGLDNVSGIGIDKYNDIVWM